MANMMVILFYFNLLLERKITTRGANGLNTDSKKYDQFHLN